MGMFDARGSGSGTTGTKCQVRQGPHRGADVSKSEAHHGFQFRSVATPSGSQRVAGRRTNGIRGHAKLNRLLGQVKVSGWGCSLLAAGFGARSASSSFSLPETEAAPMPLVEGIGDDEQKTFPGKLKLAKEMTSGTFEMALAVARSAELRESAMTELRDDFWAASNKAAKLSKRRLVVELAQAVGGPWWTPPLTEKVVVRVAAALKAAGLKSASWPVL